MEKCPIFYQKREFDSRYKCENCIYYYDTGMLSICQCTNPEHCKNGHIYYLKDCNCEKRD